MSPLPIHPSTLRRTACIVALFAFAVLAAFWFHAGLDMYPLDDGWAMFSSDRARHFSGFDFLFSNRRELRKLPYIIAMALEHDGFATINALLVGINLLTWLALFVVLYHVLRKQPLEAFVASALVMLFPNDPTMFWLGAFGVNLSYGMLLGSIALTCIAVDRQRRWLQVPALLLYFVGIKTYPGFIALPPIMVAYLLLRDRPPHPLRRLLQYLAPQAVIVAIAAAPALLGSPLERGRDSRVASLDPSLALEGYGRMARNMAYGWTHDFSSMSAWMLPYAAYFLVLVAAALSLLATRRDTRPGVATAADPRAAMLFIGMCLGVIVFGYLPFALSVIRFNPDRPLMGSRIGFVCLLVAAAGHLCRRDRRSLAAVMVAVTGVVIVAFALNKLSVFDERYRRSLHQRVFLADLAATVRCPSPLTPLVFHTADDEFNAAAGGETLNLRPQLPVRTMYASNHLPVFTLNQRLLSRLGRPRDAHSIQFRRQVIGPRALLLEYGFRQGMHPLSRLAVETGNGAGAMLAGVAIPPATCEPTPLMRALLRDRAGYLRQLGLTR